MIHTTGSLLAGIRLGMSPDEIAKQIDRNWKVSRRGQRNDTIAELRAFGWTVFCDEEEDDGAD